MGLFTRLDQWLEKAALRRLPPAQRRAVDAVLVLATLGAVAISIQVPHLAAAWFLAPLVLVCFFRGLRGGLLVALSLAAVHLALARTPAETGLFLMLELFWVTFAVITLGKYRASRRHELSLEQALCTARQVQCALEPRACECFGPVQVATALRVCTELGGDLLCTRSLGPKRFGLLIGDVMGKGVQAALTAAYLEGLFENLVPHHPPGPLLVEMNRSLHNRFQGDVFATLLALEIDLDANLWKLARAGHPPALMVHAAGTWTTVEPEGLVAGVLPNESYPEMQFPLCPGDQILLVTDGLWEGGDARDLAHMLKARATRPILRALQEVVGQLARSTHAQDDQSAAWLRVAEN